MPRRGALVSLTLVPCASATFTVWSSAWLAGAAAPDDVLDALGPWAQAHDVVAADTGTALAHSLSAPGTPAATRRRRRGPHPFHAVTRNYRPWSQSPAR